MLSVCIPGQARPTHFRNTTTLIPRASRDLYLSATDKDPGSAQLACRDMLRPGPRGEGWLPPCSSFRRRGTRSCGTHDRPEPRQASTRRPARVSRRQVSAELIMSFWSWPGWVPAFAGMTMLRKRRRDDEEGKAAPGRRCGWSAR